MALVTKIMHKPPPLDDTWSSSTRVVPSVEESADTPRNDEKIDEKKSGSTVVEEGGSDQPYTEAESKKLVRKLDRWILPIMCTSYALQFWDKTLLSQSILFGLARDLKLTPTIGHDANGNAITDTTRFSNVSWVFYLGYLVAAYPNAYLAQRFPTAKVCAVSIFLWSIVVMSTAGCKNYSQLMVNRFFLGVCESCLAPAFTVYITFWWTRSEQALRSPLWFGSVTFAMVLGPLASYGLGHIHGDLGSSWKYLYLIAGAISCAWSFVVLVLLPDDPHRAKWLSAKERSIVLARLKAENSGGITRQFVAAQFWEALTDYNLWSNALYLAATAVPGTAMTTFSGLVIHGFGFDSFTSVLLTVPLGVVAMIFAFVPGFFTRRLVGSRYYFITSMQILPLIGCFIDWLSPRHERGLLYFGLLLLPSHIGGTCLINAQISSNSAGHTKKTTISAATFIGYSTGNIIAPILFSTTPGPRYSGGFISCIVCLIFLFLLLLLSRWYLARENKRREREYGPPTDELGLEDVTDKQNKNFRYMI